MGDGLDRVVEAVAAMEAAAQDLAVLHAGEGALDTGPRPWVLGVVALLVGQQGPAGAFAAGTTRGRC
nr:hypothetical protein [Streptomyces sp. PanSC19]